MAKKIAPNVKLLKDYLFEYPAMPTLTLAKLIYSGHPAHYKNIENVRDMLRYYTGKRGKANREQLRDRRFLREMSKPFNPLALPESDEKEFDPVHVDLKYKRILVLGDIHIPYHNIRALTAALEYGKTYNPDLVLFNGDLLDCHCLSSFEKDPDARSFPNELDMLKTFMDRICIDIFPKADIMWKFANHEARYDRYFRLKAPELLGIDNFTLESHFGEYDIQFVKDKRRIVIANHLSCFHGDELGRSVSTPVNPARTLFQKTFNSSFCGHFHRASRHTENRGDGSKIITWSFGCLSELHPNWMPMNRWGHGFGTIDINGDHDYRVSNYEIIKGRIV